MNKQIIMRKLFLIFIFLIDLYSCSKIENPDFDTKLISKMSNEDLSSGLPSKYSTIPLFAKCNDNKIALTSIEELRAIHSLKYNDMKFFDFLSKTLNQKLDISYRDKIICIDMDKDINDDYEKNDFGTFLNSYTEKINGNLILKSSLTKEKINTVSYYLFINNYVCIFDDYIGFSYIKKTDSFY